jgi:hypothetical protein
MNSHPTPWSVKYTNFGESMGYDSRSVIIDANGHVVVTIGNGSGHQVALAERTASQIVQAVNGAIRETTQ